MNSSRSKWWFPVFLAIPVMYFAAQFLPYYHSGGSTFPSLWALFWYPERNQQTINFLALYYHGFRINEFVTALFITQMVAIFLIIITLIKKNTGIVAVMVGCWGVFGLISFFTTRALTFSVVAVYGGIAGIIMLALFLAAVVASGLYLVRMYLDYKALVTLYNAEQAEHTV